MHDGTCLSSFESDRKIKRTETPVSEVEPIPLHYLWVFDIYSSSLAACTLQQINVAREVIHFWRMGSARDEGLAELSY